MKLTDINQVIVLAQSSALLEKLKTYRKKIFATHFPEKNSVANEEIFQLPENNFDLTELELLDFIREFKVFDPLNASAPKSDIDQPATLLMAQHALASFPLDPKESVDDLEKTLLDLYNAGLRDDMRLAAFLRVNRPVALGKLLLNLHADNLTLLAPTLYYRLVDFFHHHTAHIDALTKAIESWPSCPDRKKISHADLSSLLNSHIFNNPILGGDPDNITTILLGGTVPPLKRSPAPVLEKPNIALGGLGLEPNQQHGPQFFPVPGSTAPTSGTLLKGQKTNSPGGS